MSEIKGWKYYNHAAIPECAPDEKANLQAILDGSIWKLDGKPLLARWTEDFDCKEKTEWWYIIKEGPFDINELSAKRRKNIRQSLKKCKVIKINPEENIEELYKVYESAYMRYIDADNYMTYDKFVEKCKRDKAEKYDYWGGYIADNDQLTIKKHDYYVESCIAKYNPQFLNYRVSDAIHYTVLEEYLNIQKKRYITAGERSINHVTNAQKYKIENFNFRKAYCNLHLVYRPPIKIIINFLYPFRIFIKKYNKNIFFHQVSSVLLLEEISRENCKVN